VDIISSIKVERTSTGTYFAYPELFIMCFDKIHILGRNLISDSSKKHWKRHPRGFRYFWSASNYTRSFSLRKYPTFQNYTDNALLIRNKTINDFNKTVFKSIIKSLNVACFSPKTLNCALVLAV